jgi:hypothetical protein
MEEEIRPRRVYLCTTMSLARTVLMMWDLVSPMQMFQCYPSKLAVLNYRPRFPERIPLFEEEGPIPSYWIYIGRDVEKIREEHKVGAELPITVLESAKEFSDEVVRRVRYFVGSPVDN